MIVHDFLLVSITFVCFVYSAPQQAPEINDELQTNYTETENKTSDAPPETNSINNDITIITDVGEPNNQTEILDKISHFQLNNTALLIATKLETPNFISKFYIAIKTPIIDFIQEPRVNIVLKNIGTCIVNGAMEIISYYFPAPLIPLIASAAGTIIPFEPVVMLRNRMPVTSYRRAFNKAVNSFMGTFDRFKASEEDPYMAKRFNRRFMKDNSVQDKIDK